MNKLEAGDVFRIEMPNGNAVSGRVLLDIEAQCIRPKRVSLQAPLAFFDNSLLIEVYRELSGTPRSKGVPLLIPGIIFPGPLVSEEWPKIGFESVEVSQVEFPEAIGFRGPHPEFYRGEVVLPLDVDPLRAREMKVPLSAVASSKLGPICANLLSAEASATPNLTNRDLRFSPLRAEVYAALGLDPDEPYFPFALRQGFDLRRFYEPVETERRRR